MFRSLKCQGEINGKRKYFTYVHEKATYPGTIFFLPEIHKRLSNLPSTLVI